MSSENEQAKPHAAAREPVLSPGIAQRRRRRPLDPVLLERFAETGFLATEFGLHEQAEHIFECLVGLKPGKPSPVLALAIVRGRRGRINEAIGMLRELIEQHPDFELARAILGSMLLHIADAEGSQMLQGVIARDADSSAVGVATSLLEQAQLPPVESAVSNVEFYRHYNPRT